MSLDSDFTYSAFEVLASDDILDNPWMPVQKQHVRLPNGEEVDWYLNTSRDCVIVLPLLDTGEILLQRAYKHGARNCVIEFCAGIIENDEDPIRSAHRELLEETGYSAQEMLLLGTCLPNPTGSSMRYFIILGKNCQKIDDPRPEPSEQIQNFTVQNISEAEDVLFHPDNTVSSSAFIGLGFLRRYFKDQK